MISALTRSLRFCRSFSLAAMPWYGTRPSLMAASAGFSAGTGSVFRRGGSPGHGRDGGGSPRRGGGAQGGGPLAEAGGLFVALRPVAEVSGGRYGLGDGHSWGEQRDGEGDGREGGG
ncbi:hypothetical protein ACFSTC_41305 [Nonomuraea ferruginea]